MRKILYRLCGLALMTAVTFSPKYVIFGQETIANQQTEDQLQVNSEISKIEIEPYLITKNHSQYTRLTCGSSMKLLAKVYLKDGSIATGKNAEVTCELRKKDGSFANAVSTLKNPTSTQPQNADSSCAYAKIEIYAPYGLEENLELIVTSTQNETVKQTYSFQTVSDVRDGVSISKFKLGTTAGKVRVTPAKEIWNVNEKSYTVTMPKVTAKNSADVFIGWKAEDGTVYASGKSVCVNYNSLHEFEAVWKNKPGTSFPIKEKNGTTRYTITKKGGLALVQHIGIIKGPYTFNIPATVEFHNKTYKVESIEKGAFSNTSVQKLVIGKNINKIGLKSFGNNRFLKTILIRSNKIKSVGTGAMKKINKNVTIQCPKANVKAYTKLFQKAGLHKNVKIKGF